MHGKDSTVSLMSSVEIVHGNHIFTFMCSVSLVNVCEAIAAGV